MQSISLIKSKALMPLRLNVILAHCLIMNNLKE